MNEITITSPQKRGPGRPTSRTKATLDLLLAAAETGAPIKSCCATARTSYENFRLWAAESPEVAEQFAEARERGRVSALRTLQLAAANDWRAAAEWLRLSFRSDYSPRAEISLEGGDIKPKDTLTEFLVEIRRGKQPL